MKKIGSIIILCSMIVVLSAKTLVGANIQEVSPDTLDAVIPVIASAESQFTLVSPSAVLIEGSTGTVIFDKDKDKKLRPASVTKVMTLLLIFEAIDAGDIKLTDEVTVSEHAASMGGSQVYLEPFEIQTVETMIKCISIASANDASVALAEHISGSEEQFIARMNERAKELGMMNTNFVNCYGLDADNHYTTAYDIALMSRELITKFPEVTNYTTVWMDTFVHTTKKGRTEFGLTNTNKLIKSYNGITGLKTGSTSLAKYCLSATARRNNMDLIAVIMAAPDPKTRFAEAAKLLNHGYANYSIFTDDHGDTVISPVRVSSGVKDEINGIISEPFSYLCDKDKKAADITKEVVIPESVPAPIQAQDKIGEVVYYIGGEKIGSVDILASEDIPSARFKDCFIKSLKRFFINKK